MSSATTPSLTLTYFPVRAKAELCRLLLAAADTQYTSHTIEYKGHSVLEHEGAEEWSEIKHDVTRFPFGQMPVLTVGGVALPQSHAIERYIAREYGLMGKTNLEAALIDAVNETILEQREAWRKNKSAEDQLHFLQSEDGLIKQYKALEAFAKRHGDGQHFVGNTLSYADIAFYYNHYRFNDHTDQTHVADEVLRTAAPSLHAINEVVKANKGIAHRVATRPKTVV